jgi:hypothetical protein
MNDIDKLLTVYSEYAKKYRVNFPTKGNRSEQLQSLYGHLPKDQRDIDSFFDKMQEWIVGGIPKQADGPVGKTEWLSNYDIDHYLYQFQEKYPDFRFLRAVPLDCDQHSFCTLHQSNLDIDKELKSGKKIISAVYNLDKVGQPGSHWVVLVMDFKKKQACYYNPAKGDPPDDVNRMINKFKKMVPDATVTINNAKHQNDTSECGIYSINFILRYLRGESFNDIIKNGLSFDEINSCRSLYFRKSSVGAEPHHKC